MQVVNNKRLFRFEINLPDGEVAELEYRWLKGSMVLMHTRVPANHRKQGIGQQLVKFVLDHAQEHNLKVIVYCPFVAKFIAENPEYELIVAAHS